MTAHAFRDPELTEQYRSAGFGGRVGWGQRPALLIIDMAGAWTTREELLGSDLTGVVDSILVLLEIFRRKNLPRYFTTMAYDAGMRELGDVYGSKIPALRQMVRGSSRVTLIPELDRRPEEPLLEKPRASAFFGTNLTAQLISDRVDTIVLTGCSTSGCIRATGESAINRNLHVIVPEEAVGDRCATAHAASLFDIDNRCGDVMPLREVVAHLEGEPAREERGVLVRQS